MESIALPLQAAGDWIEYPESVLLFAVLALAGIGTGVLLVLSLVVYNRRRTRTYALVTLAIGMLFFRSIVGLGTVSGAVSMPVHHLIAHSIDFVIAGLILYAAYGSGPSSSTAGVGHSD
ncbi:MAG: hypothetical protein RI568_12270 [Natronomonas sp.]|jgi:bacteriorhodopsin|uniref:DUF7471 family protein n=1 Tax=Natronomonas sp. TaxID=2184060 RepID=UPI0028705C69|nr:hypothetical protein [Natronomonas sp.]MDR9431457.1 hypothetical protein [Natronomonas sp.]